MKNYILDKNFLKPFLRKVMKKERLIAPIEFNKDIIFDFIDEIDEITTNFTNSIISPKRFFFPQSDTILEYEKTSHVKVQPIVSYERRVIFGIRSCDVYGLLNLDKFYSLGYEDIYYLQRRENVTLINLVCSDPCENGFCIYAKSGPKAEVGFDLQFTDLGDKYFVEVGSVKGEELIKIAELFFSKIIEKDEERRFEVVLKSKSCFSHLYVDLQDAALKLKNNLVSENLWQELADRCQRCGGCNYVCPTCTCFDVVDKDIEGQRGRRVRLWDSCVLGGFTRLAGGYNPRSRIEDRVKRKFYHKLSYEIEKFQATSCVGCGRCTTVCLGNIDTASVVRRIVLGE
ncbi:MAG: 4Fe-4S dicluster domain-containing protein [bacterium]|nr:4Fe-4S dicluster domain-containing protein [bacterium]